MFSGIKSASARQHVKNCDCDFTFSKMAATAILDFQKFKFLPADTIEIPNLRKPAKFHQDPPIRC